MRSGWRVAAVVALALLGAFLLASALGGGRFLLEIEHRIKSALARHTTVATLDIAPAGTFRMFLNPLDIALTPIIMGRKSWEPNETFWFTRSLREGDTVVDIGANVGYYTVLAAKIVGDAGRVFAFEPDPEAFAILERNVRLNGLRNVVAEQKALSNENGTLELFLASANRGDHRIYQPKGQKRESVTVEAVVLDDYFRDIDGRVDFVKIDTQGAEGVIFEGLLGIARENADVQMAIEFWPYGLDDFGYPPQKLVDMMTSVGFRFYDLGIAGLPAPLTSVESGALLQRFSIANRRYTNLLLSRKLTAKRVLLREPIR